METDVILCTAIIHGTREWIQTRRGNNKVSGVDRVGWEKKEGINSEIILFKSLI